MPCPCLAFCHAHILSCLCLVKPPQHRLATVLVPAGPASSVGCTATLCSRHLKAQSLAPAERRTPPQELLSSKAAASNSAQFASRHIPSLALSHLSPREAPSQDNRGQPANSLFCANHTTCQPMPHHLNREYNHSTCNVHWKIATAKRSHIHCWPHTLVSHATIYVEVSNMSTFLVV